MKVPLLGLGAVLLLASVLSPRLVGAAGVLLRYHFVAGQVITYRVTSTARLTEREGSTPAITATDSHAYRAHYRFGQLRADGAATLTIRADHVDVRLTQAGKTTHPVTSPSATQFLQEPGGRRYTKNLRYYGGYSDGDLGSLSPGSVAVGSTWVSTLTDGGPIYRPGPAGICPKTPLGFVQAPGRVAPLPTGWSMNRHRESPVRGQTHPSTGSGPPTG